MLSLLFSWRNRWVGNNLDQVINTLVAQALYWRERSSARARARVCESRPCVCTDCDPTDSLNLCPHRTLSDEVIKK